MSSYQHKDSFCEASTVHTCKIRTDSISCPRFGARADLRLLVRSRELLNEIELRIQFHFPGQGINRLLSSLSIVVHTFGVPTAPSVAPPHSLALLCWSSKARHHHLHAQPGNALASLYTMVDSRGKGKDGKKHVVIIGQSSLFH